MCVGVEQSSLVDVGEAPPDRNLSITARWSPSAASCRTSSAVLWSVELVMSSGAPGTRRTEEEVVRVRNIELAGAQRESSQRRWAGTAE